MANRGSEWRQLPNYLGKAIDEPLASVWRRFVYEMYMYAGMYNGIPLNVQHVHVKVRKRRGKNTSDLRVRETHGHGPLVPLVVAVRHAAAADET